MFLETLEEKRKKSPLNIRRLLKKVAKSPFWLQPAEPKKRPLVIDKQCLMELGLNEIQSEILLALWEARGQLPIWGEGEEDLCHELNTTSAILRKNINALEDLGLVRIRFNGKMELVIARPPKEVFEIVEEALYARLQILSELFKLKQKELEEKSNKRNEIVPRAYKLSFKARASIKELKKCQKIVCGFVIGRIENNGENLVVENFIPVQTRSGPTLHFNPVWKDYHRIKKELIKNNKWILGEFHIHIDGDAKLHERDLEKMKMLSRGIWWILGEENICYFFSKNNDKLNLTKIPCLIK